MRSCPQQRWCRLDMTALARIQRSFLDALNHGPAHLDTTLFAGDPDRVMLAMKAHANTVSHARLVAIEATYPLTREQLGEGTFNRLSRAFLDLPGVAARPLATIGEDFGRHLEAHDSDAAATAAIEWAWLQSYHAADAVPLTMAMLAGLDETALLELVVARHPALKLVRLGRGYRGLIDDLAGAGAVFALRPGSEVRLHPADKGAVALHDALAAPLSIGNLLGVLGEQVGEGDELPVLIGMIELGGLILP